MSLEKQLPKDWHAALSAEFQKTYWAKLESFVAEEYDSATVYPPKTEIFSAFQETPFDSVKLLLLGQDPYHGAGQGHGLSFSVRPGVALPPSLRNIYKELESDLGIKAGKNGYLLPWAKQGVLLLNAVLTVREATPGSHAKKGWEKFSDAVISALNARSEGLVFLLWGGYARKKASLIDGTKHRVIESAHPSPLSANAGFFGSQPFSKVNSALEELGRKPIDWEL